MWSISQVSKPFQNCYATHLLRMQNIRIYRENNGVEEEILNHKIQQTPDFWNKPYYKKPTLQTGNFEKSGITKSIRDLSTLSSLGYGIYRHRATKFKGGGFRNLGQRTVYSLRKIGTQNKNPTLGPKGPITEPAAYIPKHHTIIYDTINRWIMIRGPHSDNTPVYLDAGRKKERMIKKERTFTEIIDRINNEHEENETPPRLKINELVVGISQDRHKLVCIPRMEDPPRIGVCGTTGSSKTLCLHSLTDQLTHSWKALCAYLNDWKGETVIWSKRTKTPEFGTTLRNLGLEPRPLPIVELHPQIKGYDKERENNLEPAQQKIAYYTPLPWTELIDNYNVFFGQFEGMELGKSDKRVPWEKIREAQNTADFYNILGRESTMIITNPKTGHTITKIANEDSFDRIKKSFKHLFSQGITDIDSGISSQWTVRKNLGSEEQERTIEELKLHPLIACMYCNLVPSVNTQKLQTIHFGKKSFLPAYTKYLTQLILDTKRNTKIFDKDLVIPVIDELEQITLHGGNESIIELSALGRSENIGFAWATINYTKVPHQILSNTHYLFAMQHSSESEINRICKDYGAGKYTREEIKTLGRERKHETMILHTKPLILYDLDNGDREIIESEPIKAIVIPPMSEHKRPSSVKGDIDG